MNDQIKESELFTTFDIGLAAALIESGHSIDCLDRTKPNRNRVEFVFEKTPGLIENVSAYTSNSLTVSARSYKDTLRTLKSKVHNQG